MASDASFTQTIFFIASIVIAVSIAGVLMGMTGMMVDEMKVKADATASEMGSSIAIVNDPRNVPYSEGRLTLYIKNLGNVAPSYESLLIFIDGEYIEYYADLINGANRTWSTGSVIEVTVMADIAPGDHTVKAILSNGISDTLDFRL